MSDDRKELKGPFDFKAMFGAAGGDEKPGVARAAADAAGHDHPGEPGHDDAERCRRMAQEVQWEMPLYVHNIMRPCRGEIEIPPCAPLKLPDIRPRVYVFWGASRCDCIESDDTEIMTVLVYNPYSNVSLGSVEINRIRVVDSSGNPVGTLPDGSDVIQLVPRGTYCFGDLGPCQIAFRQFVLRLRGAKAMTYRILIEGICFEICHHRLVDECVQFDVCPD
jgi:hypothetical protein